MTTNFEFQKAAQKARPVFDKIQRLYRQLPPTTCNCRKPGNCCAFLPEMTLMEALQWLWVIQQQPDDGRKALVAKFVEFYLTNPIRHMGCPFLSEGHCAIYEFRTFACRAYGLWSQTTGRERTRRSRNGKQALVKMWQRWGVDLPAEALVAEMDYCDQVDCQPGSAVSDDRLMAVLEDIYRLDNELADLQLKFENEYHSDFSYLITSLVLNPKKAVLGKMAVIKELSLTGTEQRLKHLLSQIKPANITAMD
jgi:Fe-S-cluster containining protein